MKGIIVKLFSVSVFCFILFFVMSAAHRPIDSTSKTQVVRLLDDTVMAQDSTTPTSPTTPTTVDGTTGSSDASSTGDEGFGVGAAIPGHDGNFSGWNDWIAAFYTFSVRIGTALTILMLIFAGYRYMTSQGNPTNINEAKDILIGSLSGYALLLLVNLILNFIGARNP